MSYLQRAIENKLAQITGEDKERKITYLTLNITKRLDPEEQVRAEFWAELIFRYKYEPHRIGIEVTVPDRTPSDRADLIIFEDDRHTRPYAVIECKQDGISDAVFNQAIEQAFGNGIWTRFQAKYVMVVAGSTRRAFDFSAGKYGVLERERNIIADLPEHYGNVEEFKYYKGLEPDINKVNREALITAIQKCHQTLWGGGKFSPPAAFGELCKLIFVKISDEKNTRKKQPYQFQIKTHETSRSLGERIRSLYEAHKERDKDVFAETIKIDDAMLRTVVSHLESINLSATDLDTKGVAFEKFMDDFFKGNFGQYFTPREIINFAVQMIRPKRDELVLDPACGSGGFLLWALDAVRDEADKEFPEHESDPNEAAEHRLYWHEFAQKNLFGIEINDEIARVAKMNMILHDDGHTNVIGGDALDRIERLREINRGFNEDKFDVVLTNPPFGAQVAISERHDFPDYELGQQTDAKGKARKRKNQKTEILFLERVWDFLKPKTGRAAIVLPDGILTNSSLQYVRDFILERFQLLAVVSLPQTAFTHYGAGVKSSIVFLRKRAENEKPDDDEAIFMAAPENIGYDATGRKAENQLPEVVEKYCQFEKNPKPFFV